MRLCENLCVADCASITMRPTVCLTASLKSREQELKKQSESFQQKHTYRSALCSVCVLLCVALACADSSLDITATSFIFAACFFFSFAPSDPCYELWSDSKTIAPGRGGRKKSRASTLESRYSERCSHTGPHTRTHAHKSIIVSLVLFSCLCRHLLKGPCDWRLVPGSGQAGDRSH